MIQKFLSISLFFLLSQAAFAQSATLVGSVRDADNDSPLTDASVVVSGTGKLAASGAGGAYMIESVPLGTYTLVVTHNGYLPQDVRVSVRDASEVRTDVLLRRDPNASTTPSVTEIPTVTLEEAEAETDGSGEVANLLNASRDVFQQISGFGWSNFRFRERGYDSEHFPLFLNGVSINDPETGYAFYGEIGGLNDVLRNRSSSIGLAPCEFAFAEIGGATALDTRASSQRKQIRATHAVSNRTYTNRTMLTLNTGLMPGGWAVSLSGSRRWGQEGYFDGTFFDGYSYFLSVDKKLGRRHALNLTFLGAPNKRGKLGDTFEEMYELAGTHRYNPNWGYQNGEKRNSNVGHGHQPIGIMRYDWAPQPGTSVMFSVYGQAGERGDTRIEWADANNPAPDHNRRLPSAILDPALAAEWAGALRSDENLRQLDWHRLYAENSRNTFTVNDADGIAGNSVTGKRSQYIVEDQRADSKELGFNGVISQQLNLRSKIHAGANYRWYTGQNFKVVDDLLGGDFWYDINKYASQDFPGQPEKEDNDALNPHNVVRTGDVFGYNYNENIRNGTTWFQLTTDLRRFQVFFGGEVGLTQLWRTGKMLNPRFSDNSLGDSEKQSFYTYGVKGGVTFKVNGRNYLYANGYVGTKPPQFRDIFLSPRNRNAVVADAEAYTVQSVEGGFIHRAPTLRTRLTGYLTNFKGEYESNTYFAPTLGEFATLIRSGVDRQHMGVEAAFEYKPMPSWVISGATNLGYYHYTSRPLMYFTPDNLGNVGFENIPAYQDNFLVPRTPQTAATLGLKYEGKRFWFASLSFNWRDDFWYSFDALRRRAEAVLNLDPGSQIWNTVVTQQKAPSAYTLDFFGGKSWKIKKVFLNLNVGVNNILDNKNIQVSGREAYRSAYGREPDNEQLYTHEIQYAPGLNYFVSLGVRM
ncbi:MAG: carboxypeptidase-like regulatory domain-containing protein [Saprospiraceae bacterium]